MIHHLLARGIEAFRHQRGKALEQFVTEFRILLAVLKDCTAVKLQQVGIFHRTRQKIPALRRYQPRPAEYLVIAEYL